MAQKNLIVLGDTETPKSHNTNYIRANENFTELYSKIGLSVPSFIDQEYYEIGAGSAISVPVPLDGTYYIDPDMDIWITNTASSGLLGADLTSMTDVYSTASGTVTSQTGLSVGAEDYSVEFWTSVDGTRSPSTNRLISVGSSGGTYWDIYLSPTVGNETTLLNFTSYIKDSTSSATSICTINNIPYTVNALMHFVLTVNRGAAGTACTATLWKDGVKIKDFVTTEAAPPINVNLSAATGGFIGFGCTLGRVATYGGRIEDFKMYKGYILSQPEIEALNISGPARAIQQKSVLRSADAALSWWVSFQNSANWGNILYPECESGYGTSVFNTLVGSPAVSERTGGTFPTDANGLRIRAGSPFSVDLVSGYLSVLSTSASTGSVRVAEV